MGFSRRLSAEQQERLLAGAPFADGGELDEMAAFTRALPAFVREQPDSALTATLVPRLAEVARATPDAGESQQATARPKLRPARSRRMVGAKVAVAVALLPALLAGLAVAGVRLPEPARDAFERVGVDLPNQSVVEDGSTEAEGSGGAPDAGGEAAKKRKQGTERNNPARARGRGNGAQGKGRALGKRGLAPGRTGSRGRSGSVGGGQGGGGGQSGGGGKSQGGSGKATGKAGASPPAQAQKPVTPPGQPKAGAN